jgi:hypothetical protein
MAFRCADSSSFFLVGSIDRSRSDTANMLNRKLPPKGRSLAHRGKCTYKDGKVAWTQSRCFWAGIVSNKRKEGRAENALDVCVCGMASVPLLASGSRRDVSAKAINPDISKEAVAFLRFPACTLVLVCGAKFCMVNRYDTLWALWELLVRREPNVPRPR